MIGDVSIVIADEGTLDGSLSAAYDDDGDVYVAYYEAPANEDGPAEMLRVFAFSSGSSMWSEIDSSALSPDAVATSGTTVVNSVVTVA